MRILKKILPMRLLSLSKYLCFFIFLFNLSISANSEESVDIWKKEIKEDKSTNIPTEDQAKQNIKKIDKKKNKETEIFT